MTSEEYADKAVAELIARETDNWKNKYGPCFYNAWPVLNVKKRVYVKAWHEAEGRE